MFWLSRNDCCLQSAMAEHDTTLETLKNAQRHLTHARQELEKRILEHDMCVVEKKADHLLQVTLQQIKDQEGVVQVASQNNKVCGALPLMKDTRLE